MESASQTILSAWWDAMSTCLIWGGLVVVLAGVAELALGRARPEMRRALWRLVYLKLMLLLVGLPAWHVGDASGLVVEADAPAVFRDTIGPPRDGVRADSGPRDVLTEMTVGSWNREWILRSSLFGAWMMGSVVAGIRWVGQWRAVDGLVGRARAIRDSTLRRRVEAWVAEAGKKQGGVARWAVGRASVRVHGGIGGPRVAGVLRSVVLMPEAFETEWSDAERHAVMAHELAHVAGHDLFWRWIRGVVRGVLFFHPLMAWAERRAAMSEEMVCDRSVVRDGVVGVVEYGRTLLRVAAAEASTHTWRRDPSLMAGMGRQAAGLRERIRGLGLEAGRWRGWMVLGLAMCVMAPLGWMVVGGSEGIRQLDPRYPVAGFMVSRGTGHRIVSWEESCRIFGMGLRRVRLSDGFPDQASGPGLPTRLSGWLSRLRVPHDYRSGSEVAAFGGGGDGYAFFVLLRRVEGREGRADSEVRAELVDDAGERVPLFERADGRVQASKDEVLRIWTLEPAPRTSGSFFLSLRRVGDDREVARLRVGALGGPPEGETEVSGWNSERSDVVAAVGSEVGNREPESGER